VEEPANIICPRRNSRSITVQRRAFGWSGAMSERQIIEIYGGRRPGEIPAYLIPEAAHYLRLPVATVRSWTLGRRYPTQAGSKSFTPIIRIADPAGRLLSFQNLLELHVLGSIRRFHHVELKAIRRAIRYLRERLSSECPLLDRQMLTDGKDLFIEQYGELVNISQQGQMEMKRVLSLYLRRLEWNPEGFVVRLFPFTRDLFEQSPRLVSIDPQIHFGKPCIARTRITTAIVAGRHRAGDSISLLAEDYGRPGEEIEEAIRYESRIAA
jgi:uncharacterized protein (DUF433 family)